MVFIFGWFLLILVIHPIASEKSDDVNLQTHIVVIDAGSTGTRLNYYAFEKNVNSMYGVTLKNVITLSTKPGISSFMDNPTEAANSVVNLIQDGLLTSVSNPSGDLMVKATAGIRMLNQKNPDLANRIMETINGTLYKSYVNKEKTSTGGKFNLWPSAVGILPGVEEGDYGWLAMNFLMDQEMPNSQHSNKSIGVMDLGGASTQITFKLKATKRKTVVRHVKSKHKSMKDGGLTNPMNTSVPAPFKSELMALGHSYQLYSHSYLGLGQTAARLLALNVSRYCVMNDCIKSHPPYETPCLHPNFNGVMKIGASAISIRGQSKVTPQNRFNLCLQSMRSVVENEVRSLRQDNIEVPPFVLLSSYYYTFAGTGLVPVKTINKQPTTISLKSIAKKARKICSGVIETGDYAPYYCMNYSYYVALLHYGYQLPWKHKFQCLKEINGFSPDWALGLALSEVYNHVYRGAQVNSMHMG